MFESSVIAQLLRRIDVFIILSRFRSKPSNPILGSFRLSLISDRVAYTVFSR